MTYNTYQIEYKIVGVVIKKYIDTVVGSKKVCERAMQIRKRYVLRVGNLFG